MTRGANLSALPMRRGRPVAGEGDAAIEDAREKWLAGDGKAILMQEKKPRGFGRFVAAG